jgi:hypothetical protein
MAGGLATALLIGAVAGLLPALRAARMSPTQAPVGHLGHGFPASTSPTPERPAALPPMSPPGIKQ